MKKLPIILLIMTVVCLFLTFFVAEKVEKEIRVALAGKVQPDISIELLNYDRHFFTATAISKIHFVIDSEITVVFNITSSITHYPFQAKIVNKIDFEDQTLAQQAEHYFGTPDWIVSASQVNLFSQLTGLLTILPGKYVQGSEFLSSDLLLASYQLDLKDNDGEIQIDWQGVKSSSEDIEFNLNDLKFNAYLGRPPKQSDYDYKLMVDKIEWMQKNKHSLLKKLLLTGQNQLGEVDKTIDTYNELSLGSYQYDDGIKQLFNENHIKLALKGLFQPAFEKVMQASDSSQEIEAALLELTSEGAQLTLSALSSKTPWGMVEGEFDFTFDKGTPLLDVIENPYILFDYMRGDANLALPIALLDEPEVSELLQMGLMTGFLLQDDQTLTLEASFLQGELIVNDRVIPL